MDYNILIGGAAGQGMDTVSHMLNKVLQKSGYYVYQIADYMSRVRGGHNFFKIRFSDKPIYSHRDKLDMIFALNEETVKNHIGDLSKEGIVIMDEGIESYPAISKYPLIKTAKELGNEKLITSMGLGIILNKLGLEVKLGKSILESTFKDEVLDLNINALERGYGSSVDVQLKDNKQVKDTILINGNTASALGAVAAGCKFYCGYPMTPSSSVLDFMCRVSEEMEIAVDQVEDEVAALNMALGASYTGVRSMTGSSGGGLALMMEAMSMAGIIETPIVVINVQRPGPATGLPTDTEQSDLRFMIHSGHGEFPRKVMAFRDNADAFHQTVRAFDIADKYQIPVILLSDQYIADTQKNIEPFDLSRIKIDRHLANPDDYPEGTYKRYEITASGVSPRLIPGRANGNYVMVDSNEHNEWGKTEEDRLNRIAQVDKRSRKITGIIEECEEPWENSVDDFDTLVVSWGSTYGPVKEAVEELNKEGGKIKALYFGDVYPLPKNKLEKYYAIAKKMVVIEQNHDAQFEGLIRQECLIKADHVILKYDGRQMSSDFVIKRLREVI